MKRSLIKQFNMLIIFTVIIYIISAVSLYTFVLRNVIDGLHEEILLSNAKETSYIVDDYVQDELVLLTRFANSQKTKKWLLDIQNEDKFNDMEEVLKTYSKLISIDSVFFVDGKLNQYYTSSRIDHVLQLPKFHHLVEESNDFDQWFFNVINTVDDYDINIGKGLETDELCLWINIVVLDENEKIGVVGCSLPIEDVIQKILSESVTKEDTYVVDEHGAIQLSINKELIQVDSFKQEYGNGRSIYSIVSDSHIAKDIDSFLADSERYVEILPVRDTKRQSVVVAKIPIVNWSVIHIYNGESLTEISGITIGIALLILLACIMGFLLVQFTRLKLLLPIKEVRKHVKAYEETSMINQLIVGDDEIGRLSSSIIKMETNIDTNRQNLVEKLKVREEEVHKLYKDISGNEKNLKRLLGALPIGVVRFNEEIEIVYCNESALSLLGIKSLTDYKNKILTCRYFPFLSHEDKKHFSRTILKNQILIDYRMKLQISSFKQLDVLLNVYEVNLDGTKYYEGVIKDITKNIKYEKQLIKRANYDNLTGVLSRAAFINRLDEFISYQFGEKSFSYFITFDFDYFKMVNDKFGHLAGDRVLKSVLDTLTSLIGELGVIGRIGGDEFAAIIWEVHENHIFEFLDQLRKAVAEQEINYNGEILTITISIGYTTCHSRDDFKVLYYRSDQALYEAKGLGKNKICKNDK